MKLREQYNVSCPGSPIEPAVPRGPRLCHAHVLMKIGVLRDDLPRHVQVVGQDWSALLGTASRAGMYCQDPHQTNTKVGQD
ncbi:BnaC04g55910D [Brassica napus]|uniref:BnaC04g55910D protein n=3 Tax=Brassica TaxID=3705 RepID=A0A078J9A5_BRANA|nr:BnaC04g55910D [Brassica napus]VDD10908.1 unnamed protein product [Brassica oleracea]